jgi:hypothetical protein
MDQHSSFPCSAWECLLRRSASSDQVGRLARREAKNRRRREKGGITIPRPLVTQPSFRRSRVGTVFVPLRGMTLTRYCPRIDTSLSFPLRQELGMCFALDSRSTVLNYDLFRTLFKNRSVRNTPEDGSA